MKVLSLFIEIINRKKKLRMWFKSFERVCDVLKYGKEIGSLEICLELI
jgi:DNA-binding transcriptional regulator WhiA